MQKKSSETLEIPVTEFNCDECGKIFRSRQNLRHHLDTHKDDATEECDTCHKMFKSIKTLNDHINKYHGSLKEKICLFCKKMFSSKSYLRKHMKNIHNSDCNEKKVQKCC